MVLEIDLTQTVVQLPVLLTHAPRRVSHLESVIVVRTHLGISPEVLAARLGQAEHGEIRLAFRRRHASLCLGSTPELEGDRAGSGAEWANGEVRENRLGSGRN